MVIRHSGAAPRGPVARARRLFWSLLAVAVLAAGAVRTALAATPGPWTGMGVAASGLILIGSLAGTARIMVALERARQLNREGCGR